MSSARGRDVGGNMIGAVIGASVMGVVGSIIGGLAGYEIAREFVLESPSHDLDSLVKGLEALLKGSAIGAASVGTSMAIATYAFIRRRSMD